MCVNTRDDFLLISQLGDISSLGQPLINLGIRPASTEAYPNDSSLVVLHSDIGTCGPPCSLPGHVFPSTCFPLHLPIPIVIARDSVPFPVCALFVDRRLVTQEREAKRNYKEAFEALTKAKEKMEASAKQEEALRRDLIEAFDGYFEAKVRRGGCQALAHRSPSKQYCFA